MSQGADRPRPGSTSSPRGVQGCWLYLFLSLLVSVQALRASGGEAVLRIQPDAAALMQNPRLKLPKPPLWVSAEAGGLWDVEGIAAEFSKITDYSPNINYCQNKFVRPSHPWLVEYIAWYKKLLSTLKLEFKDQAWDCDNYAQSFVAFADLLALKGGEVRGSVCVGWAVVANSEGFGEVRGSGVGSHAVVFVCSTSGIFVIEPQSGKMSALKDYPNRDAFSEINL
jgi:hypothetical protein